MGRVWKAEQKHEAEQKKINELQKELQQERAREEMQRYAESTGAVKKKDDRLDWMYQGPGSHIKQEEYLMGRPVDKYIFEKYEQKESGPSEETGLLPGTIFSTNASNSVQDLAAKIREDPLFLIRSVSITFPERNIKLVSIPSILFMVIICPFFFFKENRKRTEKGKSHTRKRTPSPVIHKVPGYGLQVSMIPVLLTFILYCMLRNVSGLGCPVRISWSFSLGWIISNILQSSCISITCNFLCFFRNLSAEDLEQKRKEMMEFASWRDKERVSNIERYKRQDEKEREVEKKDTRDGKFIHEMKLESASTSSLEDRVKRNIHSIQRTPVALEKSFMKR
uniref:CWC25 spliceosome associated protein homolog n=1 Tax=Erpetoichthys calabaricus TaxID=27687 RepID=A0A8C4TKU4_ERPCA